MGLQRENKWNSICEKMVLLEREIELKAKNRYLDINNWAEIFYMGLLNKVFGWNLINANMFSVEEPGIDLIDDEKQIMIQISSDNSKNKIDHTIEMCRKYNIGMNYRLIMLFIKGKKKSYPTINMEDLFKFSSKKDIWDNSDILSYLENAGIKKLIDVEKYLNDELTYYSQNVEKRVQAHMRDCTEDFRHIWNGALFLEDGENELKQKDVFIHPNYIWKKRRVCKDDILLDLEIEKQQLLLVLGYPGIGKSTLISYILNNYSGKRNNIVYRLADFATTDEFQIWKDKREVYAGERLRQAIGFELKELEDTNVFFDGFDELGLEYEYRMPFLHQLFKEVGKIKNCSWIIMSRTGFLDDVELKASRLQYITLQPWEHAQINQYIEKYNECKREGHIVKKEYNLDKGIFGIPLLLYLALEMNISFEEGYTLSKLYDEVFNPKKGGIYGKSLYGRGYDVFYTLDRSNSEKFHKIHAISQKIAFWIFENNDEKALIPENEIRKIIHNTSDLHDIHELGNFLQKASQSENEWCFVHRTMYEYFVADMFCTLMQEEGEWAGKLAWFLKKGVMSTEIQRFIEQKLESEYAGTKGGNHKYKLWEDAIKQILISGSRYHKLDTSYAINWEEKTIVSYCNNVWDERRIDEICFHNLCDILQIVRKVCRYNKAIFDKWNYKQKVGDEIKKSYANGMKLNISNFDLQKVDLFMTSLEEAILNNTKLSGADLTFSNIQKAYFYNAHLEKAVLVKADLSFAKLVRTSMENAQLKGAFLLKSLFNDVSFQEADMFEVIARDSQFNKVNFEKAGLEGLQWISCEINDGWFVDAKLGDSQFVSTTITNTTFERAYLYGSTFKTSNLDGVSFHGAILDKACLAGQNISNVDFGDASLKEADLRKVIFRDSDLEIECNLDGANLEKACISDSKTSVRFVIYSNAIFEYIYVYSESENTTSKNLYSRANLRDLYSDENEDWDFEE